MADAGMRWVACNVGDGQEWPAWGTVRARAASAGVVAFPWLRCMTVARLRHVIDVAGSSGCPVVILNIEDEFKSNLTPDVVRAEIDGSGFDGEIGVSTVGWVYNDTDFSPLARLPFLLQVFWEDMRFDPSLMESKQRDCVGHARDKGITYVGVTFMTVRSQPWWYDYHPGTRSYYTGDDIGGGNWAPWAVR